VASIFINVVGAWCDDVMRWNYIPDNIDEHPDRLWSWSRPQFLAPFVEPESPFLPLPLDGVSLGSVGAYRYIGLGWSSAEDDERWTDGDHATFRFERGDRPPRVINLELRPYLAGGQLPGQRLQVTLNGQEVDSRIIRTPGFATYAIAIPDAALRPRNVLQLWLPDAVSPAAAQGSGDRRRLGVAVRHIGAPTPQCGLLRSESILREGQSVSSCDGRFALKVRADGDLVLQSPTCMTPGGVCWHTETEGHADARLVMQGDGNLVLYGEGCPGAAGSCWHSDSAGHEGAALVVQDDGNVCVFGTRCTGPESNCWCSRH
jgi:hypothetical protein